MTKPQHTPEPWIVEPINNGETYQITSGEDTDFTIIAETPSGTSVDKANAHLMAQAPSLLKILKRLDRMTRGVDWLDSEAYATLWHEARGAITRAEAAMVEVTDDQEGGAT